MFLRLLLITTLAVLFSAGQTTAQDYTASEGDVLRISVYEHDDLTTTVRVEADGTIVFPLIGQVMVSGLTANEISGEIEERLTDGYIVNPQVTTFVAEFIHNKIIIIGEISKPGIYEVDKGTTFLELISKAGGLSKDAGTTAIIKRKSDDDSREEVITIDLKKLIEQGDLTQDLSVQGGDSIHVTKTGRYYVIGEVRRPDAYKCNKGTTVIKAITIAGGFTDRAASSRIKIIRMVEDKEVVLEKVAMDEPVLPEDLIVVPMSYF
jgi:polysaccharide export outer membrane protein